MALMIPARVPTIGGIFKLRRHQVAMIRKKPYGTYGYHARGGA